MKQKTIKKVAELNGWEFDHKGMVIQDGRPVMLEELETLVNACIVFRRNIKRAKLNRFIAKREAKK